MDDPETLASLGTQDTGRIQKNKISKKKKKKKKDPPPKKNPTKHSTQKTKTMNNIKSTWGVLGCSERVAVPSPLGIP